MPDILENNSTQDVENKTEGYALYLTGDKSASCKSQLRLWVRVAARVTTLPLQTSYGEFGGLFALRALTTMPQSAV